MLVLFEDPIPYKCQRSALYETKGGVSQEPGNEKRDSFLRLTGGPGLIDCKSTITYKFA